LAYAPGNEIRNGCAGDSEIINAPVLKEALVFRGYDGINEIFWNLRECDDRASLFAEFADQFAVHAVDSKGYFRLVIRQYVQRRQVRINHDRGKTEDQATGSNQRKHQ